MRRRRGERGGERERESERERGREREVVETDQRQNSKTVTPSS